MVQILHINERKQFRKLFKQDKVDNFEERLVILELFLQTESHITSSELLKMLNTLDDKIEFDIKFVNDTLKLMCKYGFARRHQFKNGDIRYEHMHLGQHHDHMICVKCKNILEFENEELEQLQMQIASNNGFHVLQHRMELYGICPKCLVERSKLMSLSDSPKGEFLIINNFVGSKKSVLYLSSVGLRIGDEVDVIANSGKGQLVIAVSHRRLALCRKIAQKIIVQTKK